MLYSLLICTLNREKLLKKCISSIMEQNLKKFEVIIVDQSDTVNKEYVNSINVKYIHIKKKGLSNARNVGLSVAEGDYICLVDDDATYPKNWLESVDNELKLVMDDVIIGRIRDPQTGIYALNGKRDTPIKRLGFFNVMKYGLSSACVLRKNLINDIKFDDRFGVGRRWGAGEETDVLWSILEKKGTIRYAPSIVIYHAVQSKGEMNIEKISSYNLGFGALFAKHFNKRIEIMFYTIYSFLRNIGGILYYLLINKPNHRKVQRVSLISKIKGFCEYIENG